MSNNKDSLGDRMKGYENISRIYLTRRTPVIIRIDGKAFHSFTRGFAKPFDDILIKSMQDTSKYLCENIMGCKLAYTQSDEISLLLIDYEKLGTQAWFDNNLQKMVSVAASMATMAFNKFFMREVLEEEFEWKAGFTPQSVMIQERHQKYIDNLKTAINKGAMFDARAFILPKEEVNNYFIWRQQDATRNSIQMVAQNNFSHKELQGKSCNVLQDMLHEQKGINWNDYPTVYKRGSCIIKVYDVITQYDEVGNVCGYTERTKWIVDEEIPIFTQDRDYINKYVMLEKI